MLWHVYAVSICLTSVGVLIIAAGVIPDVFVWLSMILTTLGGLGLTISGIWMSINMLMAIYRYWTTLQGGNARTTPGKAIGFLFIPLFNFYWGYQCFIGLRNDMNNYIANYRTDIPPIRDGNYLVITLTLSLIPYVNLIGSILFLAEWNRRNKEFAYAASRIIHG